MVAQATGRQEKHLEVPLCKIDEITLAAYEAQQLLDCRLGE